ncbi:MAG: hypothetical protein K2Q23_09950 [Bryobacteraceae bacterium]|nr:hypothetical protein [Bryobacteraceae bacterium]
MDYQALSPEQTRYLAALIDGDPLLTAHAPPPDWAANPVFELAYQWALGVSLRKLKAA